MRIKLFAALLVAATFTLASCGGGGEGGSDVEVSAEMSDFISGFDGTSDKVSAALAKHGSSDEIKDHDMGMYDLKDPEVMGKEGDCYTLKCGSGMVENTYVICWSGGKIASIEEKL